MFFEQLLLCYCVNGINKSMWPTKILLQKSALCSCFIVQVIGWSNKKKQKDQSSLFVACKYTTYFVLSQYEIKHFTAFLYYFLYYFKFSANHVRVAIFLSKRIFLP